MARCKCSTHHLLTVSCNHIKYLPQQQIFKRHKEGHKLNATYQNHIVGCSECYKVRSKRIGGITTGLNNNTVRVALFYRVEANFAVEEVRTYGPNVLSFEVVTGRRRWYIIGCYIAPDDARTIERVVTAMGDQPRGTSLLVAGDLNTNLGATDNDKRGL